MKIVHAADLHIDSPLRGVGRIEGVDAGLLRRATRRAFERLIDLCVEEGAGLLLLAGDLFDGSWKDANSGVFLLRQLRRLRASRTRVVLIEGNHDAASRMLRHLRWAEHVHLLPHDKPRSLHFDDLGVVVHGQGFPRREVRENLAAGYPRREESLFNIGLLHTNATGSEEHDPYAPCSVAQLARHGYDYWALGHIHKGEILHEDPWIVYPGNLQGRHVRETGEKGCRLVEIEGGRVAAIPFIPLDVVRWEEVVVDIGPLQHTDDFLETVSQRFTEIERRAEGRAVIARVRATGTGPLHHLFIDQRERVIEELRLCAANFEGVWIEKFRQASQPPAIATSSLSQELDAIIRQSAESLLRGDPEWEAFHKEMEKFRKFLGTWLPGISDDRQRWHGWLAETIADVPAFLNRRLLSAGEDRDED